MCVHLPYKYYNLSRYSHKHRDSQKMSTRALSKNERLDLRVSSDIKALFSRAAEYSGTTMTAFVIEAARQRAQELIDQNEMVILNNEARDLFLEMLVNPPEPAEALRRAAENYRTDKT